ncbi:MAG: hypothetical protein H7X95_14020 [Deltaproteobacteria bacterium]|nr:hypothetical protein [Deltaproteobacteria bacterium]
MGIAMAPESETSAPNQISPQRVVPVVQGGVEILSLADLNVDPALLRSRHDHRGVIDVAPRPLVTLQSGAAIAALLRR